MVPASQAATMTMSAREAAEECHGSSGLRQEMKDVAAGTGSQRRKAAAIPASTGMWRPVVWVSWVRR
ncbi:hypothetical protein Acor_02850 [Acrocarpospora corrugata]|uniref:Uncharacterized protein n=1 Tax=Acrocarpospora corrugata TaxID=35763 RepID=A0A5M3VP35_9ACTN|nr:hypothetical protein Acor_02850 [Acrocarpospora corrugata]